MSTLLFCLAEYPVPVELDAILRSFCFLSSFLWLQRHFSTSFCLWYITWIVIWCRIIGAFTIPHTQSLQTLQSQLFSSMDHVQACKIRKQSAHFVYRYLAIEGETPFCILYTYISTHWMYTYVLWISSIACYCVFFSIEYSTHFLDTRKRKIKRK